MHLLEVSSKWHKGSMGLLRVECIKTFISRLVMPGKSFSVARASLRTCLAIKKSTVFGSARFKRRTPFVCLMLRVYWDEFSKIKLLEMEVVVPQSLSQARNSSTIWLFTRCLGFRPQLTMNPLNQLQRYHSHNGNVAFQIFVVQIQHSIKKSGPHAVRWTFLRPS